MDFADLFPSNDCQPGASDADIAVLEQKARVRLPADYRSILKHANGFNGDLGGDEDLYLRLYDTDEIADVLDGLAVLEEDFPDHLPIGDTGASWFVALDLGPSGLRYRELAMGSPDVLAEMGTTFAEFLEAFRAR